jgi:hypothetical protein
VIIDVVMREVDLAPLPQDATKTTFTCFNTLRRDPVFVDVPVPGSSSESKTRSDFFTNGCSYSNSANRE